MTKYSEKKTPIHPIFYARQHYGRVSRERRFAKIQLEVMRDKRIGHKLLGHKHPNQHSSRRVQEHFQLGKLDQTFDTLDRAAWLHGRICVPHPACPEAFELCRWISYHEAVAITGRAAPTFARWRWDAETMPDEAVWRLLEWTVHECCAWPPRPARKDKTAPLAMTVEKSPYPAAIDQLRF